MKKRKQHPPLGDGGCVGIRDSMLIRSAGAGKYDEKQWVSATGLQARRPYKDKTTHSKALEAVCFSDIRRDIPQIFKDHTILTGTLIHELCRSEIRTLMIIHETAFNDSRMYKSESCLLGAYRGRFTPDKRVRQILTPPDDSCSNFSNGSRVSM